MEIWSIIFLSLSLLIFLLTLVNVYQYLIRYGKYKVRSMVLLYAAIFVNSVTMIVLMIYQIIDKVVMVCDTGFITLYFLFLSSNGLVLVTNTAMLAKLNARLTGLTNIREVVDR